MTYVGEQREDVELRIGRMILEWAGFKPATSLDDPELDAADRFAEALGNSSVPEACETIRAGMLP